MSRRTQADIVLLACAIAWGTTFVIVKEALSDASVYVFLALRFGLAAVVLGAPQVAKLRKVSASTLRAGTVLGLLLFTGFAFQTTGLVFTTPSKSAFVTGTLVVLVPVLSAIFGVASISRWVWLGVIGAVVGLYFLTVPVSGFSDLNVGDVLTLVCAVIYATYIIVQGHYSPNHPAGMLVLLQIVLAAILNALAVPIWAVAGWEAPRVSLTMGLILAVAVTAIITTVGTLLGQAWAQKYAPPSHVAILMTIEPVAAAVISYFVEGERLAPRALLGAGLILTAILVAELKGGSKPQSADATASLNRAQS